MLRHRYGTSWYRFNNQFYKWIHYIYCKLCGHKKVCKEKYKWKRVGLKIIKVAGKIR